MQEPGPCVQPAPRLDTHWDFGAIGQAVVKSNAQGEVDVLGAEGADLLDVKLLPGLLDGDLQVVMFGQLALHDINALLRREKERGRKTKNHALAMYL